MVLEKTLESPSDSKEIKPEYSLEGLMLELQVQNFGHLRQRAASLEKTLMLEKIGGKRSLHTASLHLCLALPHRTSLVSWAAWGWHLCSPASITPLLWLPAPLSH